MMVPPQLPTQSSVAPPIVQSGFQPQPQGDTLAPALTDSSTEQQSPVTYRCYTASPSPPSSYKIRREKSTRVSVPPARLSDYRCDYSISHLLPRSRFSVRHPIEWEVCFVWCFSSRTCCLCFRMFSRYWAYPLWRSCNGESMDVSHVWRSECHAQKQDMIEWKENPQKTKTKTHRSWSK